MSNRLVPRQRFRSDYMNALEYCVDYGGTLAANKLEASVSNACELLAMFPLMHQFSNNRKLADREIRECNFDTWKILYKVEGADVILLRLLHQKQNIETKV